MSFALYLTHCKITPMVHSRPLRHWTVFVAVLALLLKAAVPLLASAAASLQGKSLADICSVYGVRTVARQTAEFSHDASAPHPPHEDGNDSDDGSHPAGAHSGDHCALSALAALAPHDAGPIDLPAATGEAEPAETRASDSIPNATAAWAARWWHAPPASVLARVMNLTDKRYAGSASVSSNTPVYSPALPRAYNAGLEATW
ncbi:hypothetical protein OOT46_09035 [Aquabacterium sp. A7-Y]|uniref:hypothetical protein n=1 Tax=Aquabacterium sp. A7-Y TaxID=1349605 RepID=UPI00223DFA6D|nr:hypothetical protein [Aquabacterium sp. A7-Y]MCW7537991.1 hypothetical protein [Aquabacterium sp. A7-Y]